MGELQEYKCPCCGGGIRFDSKAQKLKCPFCDTEFEMEALQQYDATLKQEKKDDMKWEKAEGSAWKEGEEQGLNTYHCESCGGEIVADENTAASTCPFCGNPSGIPWCPPLSACCWAIPWPTISPTEAPRPRSSCICW